MTARTSVLSAAVFRAGLLAAVLAIVAGIFGMHVMTADHSSHAAPADVGHPAGHTAVGHLAGDTAVGHPASGHGAAGHAATQPGQGASFTASESCSSGCPGVQAAGASCIPSAKAGSLAVVPPPATPGAPLEPAASTRSAVGYSFTPSSPTPCELSISRT